MLKGLDKRLRLKRIELTLVSNLSGGNCKSINSKWVANESSLLIKIPTRGETWELNMKFIRL